MRLPTLLMIMWRFAWDLLEAFLSLTQLGNRNFFCHFSVSELSVRPWRSPMCYHMTNINKNPEPLYETSVDLILSMIYMNRWLTWTCGGIHLGRVEPASPIEQTMSRIEALHARRFGANSLETFCPVLSASCVAEDSRSGEGRPWSWLPTSSAWMNQWAQSPK